jgi:hypothetical protein
MKIGSLRPLRKMQSDFPTAAVGSSQAPTATVEKFSGASNTTIQTAPIDSTPGRGTMVTTTFPLQPA